MVSRGNRVPDCFFDSAYLGLKEEVMLSPKPGLVDQENNGSHKDMSIKTFIDSIESLKPFLEDYFLAGYSHEGTPKELFSKVRQIGIKAEEKMMVATQQINTHKGANFSFGIILGAVGFKYQQVRRYPFLKEDTDNVFLYVKEMCQGLVEKDFKHIKSKEQLTNGEKLFLKDGIVGIRGEAESGYGTLTEILLPFFRSHKKIVKEELFLRGLVLLMAEVEDSNIYHRGGLEGIKYVQKESKKIHTSQFLTKSDLEDLLRTLDEQLKSRNLSPGGCADLLSLGIFFYYIEGMSDEAVIKL